MPGSRAGSRTPRFRPGYGRLSEEKVLILRTEPSRNAWVIQFDQETTDYENNIESESGDTFLLCMEIPGRPRPLIWNITGMTTEEHQATREFFSQLFDLTEPIVRERDRIAHDAANKGDDSFARIYRQLPIFVDRQGTQREDSEGIHDRSVRLAGGGGLGRNTDGGVSSHGDELADSEQDEARSQDDDPPNDLDEGVRPLG